MNLLQKFEVAQAEKKEKAKNFPEFQVGDTVRVDYRIQEGSKERIQAYEGVCIARRNRGLNSSFTVRKISYGEGVERVFPIYSPFVEDIKLVRKGVVRRGKLYYLRELSGKSARIREKFDLLAGQKNETTEAQQ
jgi:large subunit ribosomal protein L19